MRNFLTRRLGMLLAIFCLSQTLFAQSPSREYNILLKSGTLQLSPLSDFTETGPLPIEIVDGKFYRIIQFHETPGKLQREALENLGINFIEYLPRRAYIVSFPATFDMAQLNNHGLRSINVLEPRFKLNPTIAGDDLPTYAIRKAGTIDLVVKYFDDVNPSTVLASLNQAGAEVLEHVPHGKFIKIRVQDQLVKQTALLPCLSWVEPDQELGTPEDTEGRSQHRSNVLDSYYGAGRHYNGDGVTAVINDDGFAGPHIDFKGRTDQSTVANDLAGDHGDMTAGILGGAGNVDPMIKGMATNSFIHVLQYTSSMNQTQGMHLTNNVMVFSTSYSNGCNAGYTTTTRLVDNEVNTYPSIMQVFSAGNSAGQNCGYGVGTGWGTITGGHKIAKNVIAVANLYSDEVLEPSSSRGPAFDGRLKPDISSHGQGQMSTDPNNSYAAGGGTSAACPGIAGISVQMYQAYKDLNSGNEPESGLIKACLLNTADEIGNIGPDFTYGWGRVNARKAVEILENNYYLSGTVANGATSTHSITVPANVRNVRVMIHWNDPAASTSAAIDLVNDLDITLTDPGSTVNMPWVLDPTPSIPAITAPATRGVDTLNNVEQVSVDNPVAGTHTLTVSGTDVPMGPQSYWVTYYFEYNDLQVTYPNGGEGLQPGTTERVRWDANYGGSGTFTLEYTTNNGTNWSTISSSIPASRTFWDWNVPSAVSGQCWMRISRNGISGMNEAPFSIIPRPTNLRINWVCPDSAEFEWTGAFGASGYGVYMLGNKFMDSVGTTTNTTFILTGFNPFDENWVSVKSLGPNNANGRRAIAIQMPTGLVNCVLAEDVEMALLSPAAGLFPSCVSSDSAAIKVEITNTGANPLSNIPLKYSLNGGAVVTETFPGPLAPGATATHTFANTVNMLSAGTYTLSAYADLPSDQNRFNDSVAAVTEISAGVLVSFPWDDNFETFSACGTNTDCELTNCTLGNGWTNYANGVHDNIDFRTDAGGTPSQNTGPSIDANPGTSNGNYVYTEASGGCEGQVATMISPCLDLSGGINPAVSFSYHLYGTDMGSLEVDVISGLEKFNNVTTTLSGNNGNSWGSRSVDLSAFTGQTVAMRMHATTGNGWTSDLALDNFSLSLTPVSAAEALSTELKAFVYPNPTSGELNLQIFNQEAGQVNVQIYNLLMQEIDTQSYNAPGNEFRTRMDVSTYPQGVYLMKIQMGDKARVIKFEVQ